MNSNDTRLPDLLFVNARIVTMNEARDILEGAALAVRNGRIADIGKTEILAARYAGCGTVIDLSGRTMFPGLINTHVHSFQTLLKGLESDSELSSWLARVITPSVTLIDEEEMRYAAMLSALDALQSGTTTILDYQYVQYDPSLNHAAVRGYRDAGIRLVYGRGFADTGVQFGANPGELESPRVIAENVESLRRRYHMEDDGMVRLALAPSAVWMCSPGLLEWTSGYALEHGLTVTAHTAETEFDNRCSRELHGAGDFGACMAHGLVRKGMVMVHCVQLEEHEIAEAAERGAAYSYNPVSNMYLASGAAPVGLMKRYGLRGSLGTDGAASNNSNDLLESMKAGVLLAKAHYRDPLVFSAADILEYATISGAAALGMDKEIGSLETGKRADLLVFNPRGSAKSSPAPDPVAGLVYASDSRSIEMVFVNGEQVIAGGKPVLIDEEETVEGAEKHSLALRKKMEL